MENTNHTFAICAYKQSKYLEECIKSVVNQTVKTNIIICTSTPNDYIENLAKKYNIEVFVNKGKSGIGPDWNFAVNAAKTDLVTVTHQDDTYNENYVEEILNLYKIYPNFSIAFGNYQEIKNGKVIEETKNLKIKRFLLKNLINNGNSKKAKTRAIKFGSAICCPCVTVNKRVVGDSPYCDDMKCDLDWKTWYKFSNLDNPFAYTNTYLMKHRIHEESTTTSLIENNVRLDEDYEMFCKFWPKPIAKFIMHFYKDAIKTNN